MYYIIVKPVTYKLWNKAKMKKKIVNWENLTYHSDLLKNSSASKMESVLDGDPGVKGDFSGDCP